MNRQQLEKHLQQQVLHGLSPNSASASAGGSAQANTASSSFPRGNLPRKKHLQTALRSIFDQHDVATLAPDSLMQCVNQHFCLDLSSHRETIISAAVQLSREDPKYAARIEEAKREIDELQRLTDSVRQLKQEREEKDARAAAEAAAQKQVAAAAAAAKQQQHHHQQQQFLPPGIPQQLLDATGDVDVDMILQSLDALLDGTSNGNNNNTSLYSQEQLAEFESLRSMTRQIKQMQELRDRREEARRRELLRIQQQKQEEQRQQQRGSAASSTSDSDDSNDSLPPLEAG